MEEMGMCGMNTGAGLSFSEGTDDSVSRLVLSNNSSYNLCSYVWELVHLGKSLSSKMVCVKQKIVFPYV